MAKTRSQTGNIAVKKEEEEDRKPKLLSNDVIMTTRNRVTKRKPSKNRSRNLLAPDIKVEEDTDIKSLLQPPPESSKLPKGQRVSQEQINQLIDYVVNDKMNITEASCKVKISQATGLRYYNIYNSDPEKKIPAPRNQWMHPPIFSTQEQIENLIKYISEDKMTIAKASAKANMHYQSGYHYYRKYLQDPNHKIPKPPSRQNYTLDQKSKFISYIVNDKMTIKEASKKAKMKIGTGKVYYHKYFGDQNLDIATPSHIGTSLHYTQERIKEVIGYIVNGKMTVRAASKKVNISHTTASRHYRRYLKCNNIESYATNLGKRYTQDEINKFIGYIINDKMSIISASKKANMSAPTGRKHYRKYLKKNDARTPSKYTQDQKNEFIGYMVAGGMDVKTASKKANIHYASGKIYYRKYRKEHNLDPPAIKYRQDKIKELAGYIIDDKVDMKAASKKANIHYRTGTRYYQQYLEDQKRDASN